MGWFRPADPKPGQRFKRLGQINRLAVQQWVHDLSRAGSPTRA